MTDHDDMGTPTPAEHAALAVLDRRGQAAAAWLRAAAADRLAVDADAEADQEAAWPPGSRPTGNDGPEGRPAVDVVELRPNPERSAAERASRLRGRRWRAAAAAVAAGIVVTGAVAVLGQGDGASRDVSSGRLAYLLPGWLPDGVEPITALDGDTVEDGATSSGTEVVVAYGDQRAADPWERTISVTFSEEGDPAGSVGEDWPEDEAPAAEQVTVAGQPATLTARDGLLVDWAVDGGTITVFGSDAVTRTEVLAAAEGASSAPAIRPDALPAGFGELARGPQYAAGDRFTAGAGLRPAGLAIAYASEPASESSSGPQIAVTQRPGDAAAVDLARLAPGAAWVTEVRGQRAVGVARDDAGSGRRTVLQWLEPSGLLVAVGAVGLTDDELMQVAEGLRPAGDGEIARLLRDHDPRVAIDLPADGEQIEGSVESAQAEVASGERDGLAWTLLASQSSGEASLELVWGDASAASSWPVDSGSVLELVTSVPAGWPGPVVVGAVAAPATTVSVEVPGHPTVDAELHDVPGQDRRGFVVFPTVTDAPATAAVIARDAAGAEIARDTVMLDPPSG